jgi:hypothetical protein
LPGRAVALWPLPLVAGGLPAVAALVAIAAALAEGRPPCNPFIDDCGSISRMARHGLANPLFRMLVLPAGTLQVVMWLVAAYTLREAGLARRQAGLLGALGVCAGLALVVYGTFLGTEGEIYRWLRRWGTLIYFGGTYLTMLLFARAVGRPGAAVGLAQPRWQHTATLALLGFVAVISLLHAFASLLGFERLEDRIENATEWWGALALSLNYGLISLTWWRWGVRAELRQASRGP